MGISTIDALDNLRAFQEEVKSSKRNIKYGCLLLDIKGAFNIFDPLYSLYRLDKHGCPHNIRALLKSYLRKRILTIEGAEIVNENGAPQGSCLEHKR